MRVALRQESITFEVGETLIEVTMLSDGELAACGVFKIATRRQEEIAKRAYEACRLAVADLPAVPASVRRTIALGG
jgi:hypothetical protein